MNKPQAKHEQSAIKVRRPDSNTAFATEFIAENAAWTGGEGRFRSAFRHRSIFDAIQDASELCEAPDFVIFNPQEGVWSDA